MTTISELDNGIKRTSGALAKMGHMAFLVADGPRYDSAVVSLHRTSRGAMRAAKDGQTVWQWDSFMGRDGGFAQVKW